MIFLMKNWQRNRNQNDTDYYGSYKRNSHFFFQKGKKSHLDMTMYELETNTGQVLKNPEDVLLAQEQFYSQLYQSTFSQEQTNFHEKCKEFMPDLHPVLTEVQQQCLAQEISQEDLREALGNLQLNEALGLDGFTVRILSYILC